MMVSLSFPPKKKKKKLQNFHIMCARFLFFSFKQHFAYCYLVLCVANVFNLLFGVHNQLNYKLQTTRCDLIALPIDFNRINNHVCIDVKCIKPFIHSFMYWWKLFRFNSMAWHSSAHCTLYSYINSFSYFLLKIYEISHILDLIFIRYAWAFTAFYHQQKSYRASFQKSFHNSTVEYSANLINKHWYLFKFTNFLPKIRSSSGRTTSETSTQFPIRN